MIRYFRGWQRVRNNGIKITSRSRKAMLTKVRAGKNIGAFSMTKNWRKGWSQWAKKKANSTVSRMWGLESGLERSVALWSSAYYLDRVFEFPYK